MEKFDWNDISIIPDVLSNIDSRSEINVYLSNGKLPLFTAPMDMVIDENNIKIFENSGINICLPRNVKYDVIKNDDYFYSYGLDEIIIIMDNNMSLPRKILIDVANGNMLKLYNISKRIKERFGNSIELMVGNIANPETYRKYCEIGVDWIRIGIGGGSSCTTAANTGIFYPMASLINECHKISKEFDTPSRIIADGGFRDTSEIIKALALGSVSIMVGSIFNKCLESCSDTFTKHGVNYALVEPELAKEYYDKGHELFKYYRGMSTKEVQKDWNRKELKTSEGISKYNKVEYTLSGWIENFTDYLKSAMSYSGSRSLEEFIGEAQWVRISDNAYKRFHK